MGSNKVYLHPGSIFALGSQQLRRGPHGGGRVEREAGAVDGDARQRLHAGVPRGHGGEQEQASQPRRAFRRSHDDR